MAGISATRNSEGITSFGQPTVLVCITWDAGVQKRIWLVKDAVLLEGAILSARPRGCGGKATNLFFERRLQAVQMELK